MSIDLSHLGCLVKAITQQCGSSLIVFRVALCVYVMSCVAELQ